MIAVLWSLFPATNYLIWCGTFFCLLLNRKNPKKNLSGIQKRHDVDVLHFDSSTNSFIFFSTVRARWKFFKRRFDRQEKSSRCKRRTEREKKKLFSFTKQFRSFLFFSCLFSKHNGTALPFIFVCYFFFSSESNWWYLFHRTLIV